MLKQQTGRSRQNADVLAETAGDFEASCTAISEALAGDPSYDISFDEYQVQFEAERAARRSNLAMTKRFTLPLRLE